MAIIRMVAPADAEFWGVLREPSWLRIKPTDPVFLSVDPPAGTTPATVTVTLKPIALSFGHGGYYNDIGIISPPLQTSFVLATLLVNLPPPPVVTSILSAASLQPTISFGGHN